MTLRLLHVVESFDAQATEEWLRRVAGTSERWGKRYEWTFFCVLPGEGRGDEEVRRSGAKVLHAPVHLSHTARFAISLRQALKENGCDVLHCHHDVLSGLYLLASTGLRIRKRIVQVHNTALGLPTKNRFKGMVGDVVLRSACLHLADHVVGVSRASLEAFTRGKSFRFGRDKVIPPGVDVRPFECISSAHRKALRVRMGLDPSTLGLLFAGRLVEEKNPFFCLSILGELARQGVDAILFYAGTGSLSDSLGREANALGLDRRVRFLGWQENIAEAMSMADVLLWPSDESRMEGLGLVAVEAQAAGLPLLASKSLPSEAVVVPQLVHSIGLGEGAARWAVEVLRAVREVRPSKEESLSRVKASALSLEASATALFQLYDEACLGREGQM
jgi:glycosyltransferase involved in cell wall biosynthesis